MDSVAEEKALFTDDQLLPARDPMCQTCPDHFYFA